MNAPTLDFPPLEPLAERSRLAPRALTGRERFLRACRRLPADRPPIWLMRQAGRCLPEYRALKERHSFVEIVQNPELAAEVTLQPVRRFGFDAAIIFSDILVIPEALGVPYSFRETGGVEVAFPVCSETAIRRLEPRRVTEALSYVADAIHRVKHDLGGETALLGFAGSPWTLANFILEGGSCKEPQRALALFRENRALFEELCDKLTQAVITFLLEQIRAGVDAVQIFDTLGGLLPPSDFRPASGVWLREIAAAIKERVPVIVFSKGARDWMELARIGADVIGIDHGVSLETAKAALGRNFALQGNLDPASLVTDTPSQISARVETLLAEMSGHPGYIFNLGHGVPPEATLENIEAVVRTVKAQD